MRVLRVARSSRLRGTAMTRTTVAMPSRVAALSRPSAASPATTTAGPRLAMLDGIRGWASLVVLLYHLLPVLNGGLLPELNTVPVAMLLDGPLAISIFFVLSGEALSAGYQRSSDPRIVQRLATRRYFRLTVPILLASALVFFAMILGLDAHRAGARVLHSGWLGGFLQFRPSLPGLLRYALFRVYFDPPAPQHYVPMLWTMHTELLGSFVVFGLLALLHGRPQRQRLIGHGVALLLLTLFAPGLTGFVIGMLLGEARQRGWLRQVSRSAWYWPALLAALLLLFGLSTLRAVAAHDAALNHALHAWFPKDKLMVDANAAGLFLLVGLLPRLEQFMSGRLSRFLGVISFPLYLVQFAVLITVTSWLSVWLVDPAHPARGTLYGIVAASAGASLLLAYGFSFAERHALRATNAALDWVIAGRMAAKGVVRG